MSRDQNTDNDILHENALIYDNYYKDGIVDGWEQQDKAYNFSHLLRVVDLAKKSISKASILDVGCGTGDFIPTLRERHIKTYLGIDIYSPALKMAKKKYPKEEFLLTDILNTSLRRQFDFVFCSGGLSVKLQTVDNYDFFEAMIEKMWRMTKYGLAFNVLTDEDEDPADHLFYYSLRKLRKICKEIAPKATVKIVRTPIKNPGYMDEAQAHIYLIR